MEEAKRVCLERRAVPEPDLDDVWREGPLHDCARGIATELSYNEELQDASWETSVQFVLNEMRAALSRAGVSESMIQEFLDPCGR